MKERQREELCSSEARQPLSAFAVQARRRSEGATRAAQIVESSGSGETNEDPECTEGRRGRGERYKKYIYVSQWSLTRFDLRKYWTLGEKLGFFLLFDYYKFSHKCAARG